MKDNSPSILKAAWLIALVTIVSKFIGFARDMVVANFYGATFVSDAYFYALQIPSLAIIILGGVGGPFHSATVAIFSKLIGENGESVSVVADADLLLREANEHFAEVFYGTFFGDVTDGEGGGGG